MQSRRNHDPLTRRRPVEVVFEKTTSPASSRFEIALPRTLVASPSRNGDSMAAAIDMRVLPTPPPFQIEISRVDGETVISLDGDIDASTSPTLALALSSLLAEDCPSIVLDLTDVATLTVDRAWVIGEAARLFTQRDGRFAVVAANPAIRDVFEAADLGWLLAGTDRRAPRRRADSAQKGAA